MKQFIEGSIEWVQIVDRRNENGESPTAEDLAAAAFHKAMMVDRITSEKAVRVGKMLNVELGAYVLKKLDIFRSR